VVKLWGVGVNIMLAIRYHKKEAAMPRRKREEPEMITIRLYIHDNPDDKAIWEFWLSKAEKGEGQDWIKELALEDLERRGLRKPEPDKP
jgi:hypothetical protein